MNLKSLSNKQIISLLSEVEYEKTKRAERLKKGGEITGKLRDKLTSILDDYNNAQFDDVNSLVGDSVDKYEEELLLLGAKTINKVYKEYIDPDEE